MHVVFRITENKETLAEETSLPKILLPKKKKKKSSPPVAPPEPSAESDEDEADEVGHVSRVAAASTPPTQIAETSASVMLAAPQPEPLAKESTSSSLGKEVKASAAFASSALGAQALYILSDWQNGRAIEIRYDLCLFTKDQHKAQSILEDLGALDRNKFINYGLVTVLYQKLGGVIVNTRGSHDTWEFNKGLDKVKTIFFRLHGKDQYGPWTKQLVKQVIQDILKPCLLQDYE